jgi:hypothetical protein
VVRPSILGAALLYRIDRYSRHDITNSSEDYDRLWPQEQSRLVVRSHMPTQQYSRISRSYDKASSIELAQESLIRVIQAVYQLIPASVDATELMREDHFARVTNDCELDQLIQSTNSRYKLTIVIF